MVHDLASLPPALRDAEGRACREPKISRTNAINKSGLKTEKGANKALRTGQGILTAPYFNREEGEYVI
jgi:hypothetical protein